MWAISYFPSQPNHDSLGSANRVDNLGNPALDILCVVHILHTTMGDPIPSFLELDRAIGLDEGRLSRFLLACLIFLVSIDILTYYVHLIVQWSLGPLS